MLMPVYQGDVATQVERAIRSVSVDQQLRPTEVVIVRDGPVGAELQRVLDGARQGRLSGGVPVRMVELPENRGLALALQAGLAACSHDLVARADADDISLPSRFAVQLPTLVERRLDLIGAAITEFTSEDAEPGITRVLPTEAAEISRLARFRDPFNHPTVVYRRSAVRAAGGYQHLARMEDYWLFARMIQRGARVANLAEPLVLYRVGAGAYQRRGGSSMLVSELRLQHRMRRAGFTSPLIAARNVLVRGGYRLVPTGLRQGLYRRMLRRGRSL